ncbi:MAG: hypothetical protein H7Y20_14805, partial [Bryobacteraceae bacterium]|nr:hypothetical protein [Bryobacteraceae bacterium]
MTPLFAALGGTVLIWVGMSFAVTKLVGLTGISSYILWACLSVIGVLGAALFAWWKLRRDKEDLPAGLPGSPDSGAGDELDLVIKDAEAKLAASRVAGASLGNLPLVFIIGDEGSAKTSVVLQSGLGPELLAGQAHGDNNMIVPTRIANLWLGQSTVFAEAGPKVLADTARWVRMIRRLRPGNLKSVMGGDAQAPRAALVCVNAEIFTQAGAADALSAMSRALSERLGYISQTLGISFPVYVVFTRADRLPFFLDYVRTLSNEEISQVVGATLPMRTSAGGVYAEEESQRLSYAFDGLFHSLSDRRIEYLPRESDYEKVPGAFEFPREFRKMRTPLVQFLVDLCRPSQLRVSPFLRGFYFCGVRPVVVSDTPIASAAAPDRGVSAATSATGVFQPPSFQTPQSASPQYLGTKRVPQWVFLTRLFHYVILQDRAALSTSGASTRTSTAQRVLLASSAIICLLLATFWTVSFFQNRAMIGDAVAATEAIPAAEASGTNLASLDSLQRLESLRQQLETLTTYKTSGHPFAMGMGLYAGDELYPHVRSAYYSRFAQLLFRQAQGSLLAHLGAVPVSPGPNDNYSLTYDILKGYLITTTASDKASETSPAPILLSRWAENRNPDSARAQLADKQFRFYAHDLRNGNPFSPTAEVQPVGRARAYLGQFSGTERVYQFMLSSAGKQTVNYNRDVKDSSQAVINNRDVPGAFT